ncbi:MAG: carboxypeptidase regulatory-like domain-containing protein [Myxococcales bacterium]|nr:carboxypeptidase regulatory-like domain-containing protein [Myxococcales bacterium]
MNKTVVRIAIALPLLLGALLLVLKLTGGDTADEVVPAASHKEVARPAPPKRVTQAKSSRESKTPEPTMAMRDDDPIGDIRLEGQVIDEDGNGVPGATVILGSAPRKYATSEEDGSFAFESLVGRRYPVHARSESLVGGPVMVTLSETSDPVVVRMRAGGGIRVEVVDSENQPIAGALVTVPSLRTVEETTNENGIATIRNLPPGQTIVAATAPGFAKGHSLAPVPRATDEMGRQRMTLTRGTLLVGTVVDHKGKPVRNAHLIARVSGSLMRMQNPKHDGVTTDEKGGFQLTVAQGSVQLLAVHDSHPPTTSERIIVSDTEVRGIEVVLAKGATVGGRVLTPSGEPVAWPTIRVLSKAMRRGTNRQTIGEKDGTFEISGLAPEELLIHGSNQEASSEAISLDLRNRSKESNIEITLNVMGHIAGIVVDEDGEPVPEAQVRATPDFWEGADVEQMRVRGPAFATSAGDGSFIIRGLPNSEFKVTASRGNQGRLGPGQGIAARTGDSEVRLILATASSIEGQVSMSDGSTPEIATVSIGWNAGVPTAKGKFTIRDVAPGTYELTIRGPEFATAYFPDVEVKPGSRLNLGSISVEKGRVLRGTVVDKSGQAVAGAEVVMATHGTSLTPKDLGTGMEDLFGLRRATSDESGRFSIGGLGTGKSVLASDHKAHGRSLGIEVPKGHDDLEIEVKLQDTGSVRGTVSVNGKPVPNVQVLITSTEGAAHIVVVPSDERGAYYAERVLAGEQKVSAMLGAGGSGSMAATIVKVKPGATTEAELQMNEGSITVGVTVKGVEDAHIDASQVFLFQGEVDAKTGGELNALFLKAASGSKMTFAIGAQEAKFEKVVPGGYSVCVIPINGDMNDPAFAQKLQRQVGEIAVYCSTLKIAEAPEQQAHIAVVPPMQPLPQDE